MAEPVGIVGEYIAWRKTISFKYFGNEIEKMASIFDITNINKIKGAPNLIYNTINSMFKIIFGIPIFIILLILLFLPDYIFMSLEKHLNIILFPIKFILHICCVIIIYPFILILCFMFIIFIVVNLLVYGIIFICWCAANDVIPSDNQQNNIENGENQ